MIDDGSGRPKKLNDLNIRMLNCLTESDDRHSLRETTIKLNNSLKNPRCKAAVIIFIKMEEPFVIEFIVQMRLL